MADVFGDEAEQTVTINEYINDLEAAELEADMVLGGDEGKECTYSSGYMKRQAIFSCLTCVPSGNAGVCTACSLSCHDGHEIVELWTKRKFRCDCGNSKFAPFSCKLLAEKDSTNTNAGNKYNQNFQGFYCICHRPYPDLEAEEQVEMIQCCICEDWFHENHIGFESSEEIPTDEDGEPVYEDFICQDCSIAVSFLKLYPSSVLTSSRQSNATGKEKKDISANATACQSSEIVENGSNSYASDSDILMSCPAVDNNNLNLLPIQEALDGEDLARDLTSVGDVASSTNLGSGKCLVELDISATPLTFEKKPLFLSKGWRDLLCRCEVCSDFYAKKSVDYLVDKEDSMEEYEKIAKQRRDEKLQKQEGAELNFINGMDHVQRIEILNGIVDIKNELASFMESFDSSKPITAADVHGIFENLARKRQRLQ